MLVLGTVLADWYHSGGNVRKAFPWASLVLLVLGLLLMWWFPVSKNRVSSTFVLVSTGIGGLLFWGFHLYAARHEGRLKLLMAWGANPLFLYIVHLLVLAVYDIPPVPWWFREAPLWLVGMQIAFLLGVMSWLATVMHRREIILSL
jgi:predicted acyltransferase